MKHGKLSLDILKFISSQIKTVAHLELLLFLFENRDKFWSPEELSAHLRTNSTSVRIQLDDLKEMILIHNQNSDIYQFNASNSEFICRTKELAGLYREYRHQLIDAIYKNTHKT